LWATPALLLAFGGGFLLFQASRRRQRARPASAPLSPEEEARLKDILGKPE
jgi:cytochrome c-type biogenesis protein CcmH/NrfF